MDAGGGPLQWPDPAWLQPETHPLAVPGSAPPEGPPAAFQGSPPPEEMGPPPELQGSPAAPPQVPPAPVPPMAQADQNMHLHEQALADEKQGEQDRNDFMSSAGVQIAQQAARDQADADRMYMKAQDDAKARRSQLDAEAQAIATQKIDPRHAWHDASFGAKLAMGVSAIVSGMITGPGPNQVIAMIQSLNDQDTKAQETALQTRTSALATRRGLLADDVAAGHDILDFKYRSLSAAYSMAENQIKAYALKYDNPIINAKAEEQLAVIHDARLKLGMEWDQQAIENDFKNQQLSLQRGHLAAANRAAASKVPRIDNASRREDREQEKDRRERLIIGGRTADGRQLYAKDKDEATEVNRKAREVTKSAAILDELSQIYADNGWNPMGKWHGGKAGKDAQRANFLMGKLMVEFSKKEGQGTIRDSEYKMYHDMFGDPTGILDPRALFGQVRQTYIDDVNDDIQGNALDEDGNVVEDTTYWQPRAHLAKPQDKDFAEGNYQGRSFEPVPMDKSGAIIDPEMEAYKKRDAAKIKQAAPEAPRPLTPEEEMDQMYGTHQAGE